MCGSSDITKLHCPVQDRCKIWPAFRQHARSWCGFGTEHRPPPPPTPVHKAQTATMSYICYKLTPCTCRASDPAARLTQAFDNIFVTSFLLILRRRRGRPSVTRRRRQRRRRRILSKGLDDKQAAIEAPGNRYSLEWLLVTDL